MKKVDEAIKKETLFIIYGMLILSALMNAVYLLAGKWSLFVLMGNAIGAAVSVLNFFLMGITIQRSLNDEAGEAKRRMRISQQLRILMVFLAICAAAVLTVYGVVPENQTTAYIIALVLPLLFNRIIISVRSKSIMDS